MPQPRKKSTERFYVAGHDVFLYKRDATKYWWCGFHSNGSIIRSSTKEENKQSAISFAKSWYYKKKGEIDNGLFITKKHSFEKIAKEALSEYQSLVDNQKRSQRTYDGIKSVLEQRIYTILGEYDIKRIDNDAWQHFKREILKNYPKTSHGTFHQYKNGIRTVLNYAFANKKINVLPEFKDQYQRKRTVETRPWFDFNEYKKLHRAIKNHADKLFKEKKIYHANNAMELYDFVIFATNTGMRVGELMNMRFCDIKIVEETVDTQKFKVLHIHNIKGKSGRNDCKSYYGAYNAFQRIITRRKIKDFSKSTEKVFLIKRRALFNEILEKTKLKTNKNNEKRDFVSLRSTYIVFRLLNDTPIQNIALNCRNSVEVIQKHYANKLGGTLLKDLNKTISKDLIWE